MLLPLLSPSPLLTPRKNPKANSPPPQSSSLTSLTKTSAVFTGKGLYVLSTSALLVMVPWAMAYVEEQAIVEQEREMKQREVMGEGVSPGAALGKPAL